MTEPNNKYVLTFTCAERAGIVHAVTGLLLTHHGNIRELKQHDDQRSGTYFLRIEFEISSSEGNDLDIADLESNLKDLAEEHEASWGLRPAGQKKRVLIMVSKFGHCLHDLLFRSRIGELPVEIAAVVSNHPDHRQQVEWNGIPFFHVPVTAATKPEAEDKLMELVDRFDVDLVVLARYMQILSDDLTRKLSGRAINIHHSFLPSFKGAKPYHQAFERGVKTVGATAHYVNSELDEGPIITQKVQEVDHSYEPEHLVAAGRDTECKALSDAVRWHCEDRVFLDGSRTVVLR
ncbi:MULTISPECIES: formyltetrahydrofolate deformylase [Glutamicibacter]|uniref:Formyltetrahydrofolate deformylase n=1 Tax=Glutamicibacter halophytocola TaxID=1933880 RepID=A0A5B8IMI2_9MICC|nr:MULTISPECIES: formyltetrahydrofolate deformylase [Glutamicibacter]ALG30409.1 formyltetrahydrofolate deformylase [Glutamicibacter halophytocola]MBF6670414.1 formyltetrahydrofolate deformylase [Glutamicibacter sp. FBE19]QDY66663.1 formyltetrahydrofolate deformylase [Glutamicibacter halophytocola]UUX58782.1 formyltetrahydrofolate deformylase [Glutamicibacter halophytocola]